MLYNDNILNGFIILWIALVGLCLGSFFNVVILRSLSGESIVFPPSKCPKCNTKLKPWHNIPVLSYIFLKGKCAFCHEKISIQYPIVELVTMLLFVLAYLKFGLNISTIFVMIWVSCMVIMTVTDIKEKLADCNIAIIMAISGLVHSFLGGGIYGLLFSFIGLIIGVIVVEIIARSGYLFVKKRAMGEADTYVAGAIGAVCGFPLVLNALIYAFIASMFFILPVFLYKSYLRKERFVLIMSVLFTMNVLLCKTFADNIIITVLLIITGLILAWSILRSMKHSENNITSIPYIPALSAGFLYLIFFII